jgi:two-component system chemotaxis sensor kinase CheA
MGDVTRNDLWQAFFTEVSEQLDNLELILVDPDAARQADIHQLFRDFHTIKSSCAMMDFHSMERIAHASEDYLDLVRKGRTTLDSGTIDTLLKGIDWLKAQLQLTRQTGDAPADNTVLHQNLIALSSDFVDKPAPEPTRPDGAQRAALPTENRLSEDEMTEFSSACKSQLLIGMAPNTDAITCKKSLNKLVTICNLVGFTALSSLLKQYIKLKSANEIQRTLETAADIIDRITTIEHRYSADCGSTALHSQFLDNLFPDFAQFSGRLEFLLDSLEMHPDNTEPHFECEHMLHVLCVYANVFGFVQLKLFYRYCLQMLRSIRRGDFPDRKAAFDALRHAFDFPVAEEVHAGETELFRKRLIDQLAELNITVTQALLGAEHEQAREDIEARLELAKPLLMQLMPGSLMQLHQCITADKPILIVSLDAECAPERLEQLLHILTESAQLIHTYATLTDEAGNPLPDNLQCLISHEHGADAMLAALKPLDPDGSLARCTLVPYRQSAEAGGGSVSTPTAQTVSTKANTSTTLRIDSNMLDNLMTQVGEIIMIRNRMTHILSRPSLHTALASQDDESRRANLPTLRRTQQQILESSQRLQQAISHLQDRILDLRVIPVSAVFDRIPQLVRKMADAQQKQIALQIIGKDVRIDKGMVDILMEPLIHLVRNCIDHGIEAPAERAAQGKPEHATLILDAFQEGSMLVLKIADDGRGINVDRIRESAIRKGFIQASDVLTDTQIYRLIFLPGFSTAETITETSGRGVGMDVVINRINHIGGDVDVQSQPGKGTRFFLKLPLSAAIQGVVLVHAAQRLYAMPQNSIEEVVPVRTENLQTLRGQTVLSLRGRLIPAYQLADLILQRGTLTGSERVFDPVTLDDADNHSMMILKRGTQRVAVLIDALAGREEVFIRGLHPDLLSLKTLSGAAVLGNGQLVFILNSEQLLQHAGQSLAFQVTQAQES